MHRPRKTIYYTDRRPMSLVEIQLMERFSYGTYAFSVIGMLKVLAAVTLLAASVVLLIAPKCSGAPVWYTAMPAALHLMSGIIALVFYALFVLGHIQETLEAFIKADMAILILESLMALAASVIIFNSCRNKEMLHLVPAIMGLLGTLFLVIDCAAVLVTWRSRYDLCKDSGLEHGPAAPGGPTAGGIPGDRPPPPRKSIFI